MTAPARDGDGAVRAMRMALDEAELAPAAVDFVSAHGTGTVFNDAMEMVALATVLGERAPDVPVNSIKAAIGHSLAAAGAFEAIMCTKILRTGMIPPTLNCEQLDPVCELDIVRGQARATNVGVAMSTSSGFAGSNAAIILRHGDA
jgi:3-oxoacyl-[acyl-carrier-protein] synthase II